MNARVLGFFMIAALALTACRSQEKAAPRLDTFPVRLQPVTRVDLEETITVVGTIKAMDEATLFSRVPGKLLQNLVKEGDRVQKGQAVALVERDEVGVKFEPAPVPSTLTGVVARVYLDRGANVTLETAVAFVANPRQMLVKAEIPERYAGKLALGQEVKAQVEAYRERVFQGVVSRVSPVVDAVTRSTYMEAELHNVSGELRSGMFANLKIAIAHRSKALAVPVEAVAEGSHNVFVAERGKAVQRVVDIGLVTDKYVEVRSGLKEGEKVVSFGLIGLKNGSPIEVLP